jgi:hypothetical protein
MSLIPESAARSSDGDKDSPTPENLSAPLSALYYADPTLMCRTT